MSVRLMFDNRNYCLLGFSVAIGSFFSDEVTYAMAKPKAFNFKGGVSICFLLVRDCNLCYCFVR